MSYQKDFQLCRRGSQYRERCPYHRSPSKERRGRRRGAAHTNARGGDVVRARDPAIRRATALWELKTPPSLDID
ncbi:hypothetical protein EVAR_59445_1 [Eumeta japonica]|uniref:Uncharacterized protein n=1 Tax=Eumeta variegata TaxID=151549 RepID=A0A4C1Z2T4_EUMVA|nr:hypothetical protein EVAR_59445_1 [Eumeta japonica]